MICIYMVEKPYLCIVYKRNLQLMIDFNAITQTKAFARQDGVFLEYVMDCNLCIGDLCASDRPRRIACFLHPSLCSVAND